jgi:hypothetical protein
VGHAAARFEQTTIAELLMEAGPAGGYTPAAAMTVDVAVPVYQVAMLRA